MDPQKKDQESVLEPFVYDPLETSTTIRILSLYPGTETESYRGHLHHQELDAVDVDYLALGYVWGVPQYERPLFSPQGMLYLTHNLEQALKRIRDSQDTVYVWGQTQYVSTRAISSSEVTGSLS
jgi:hypothetical protein